MTNRQLPPWSRRLFALLVTVVLTSSANKLLGQVLISDPVVQTPVAKPVDARRSLLDRPVVAIGLGVSEKSGPVPKNLAEEQRQDIAPIYVTDQGQSHRPFSRYTVCACQQPLYFEEVRLERCGRNYGCAQTVVSAGSFLANAIILPYRIGSEPYHQLNCGHGDCPTCANKPCLEPTTPSCLGIATQTIMTAGMIAILL